MALRDLIHIIHIDFENRETLAPKLVLQHKWSRKVYKQNGGDAFSVALNNQKYLEPLYQSVIEECQKIYDTPIDEELTKQASYCLVTNKDRNVNGWHSHEKTKWFHQPALTLNSDINVFASSVYYFTVPEGSGGIAFKNDTEEIELMPSEGDLFFFPSDMLHSPLKNTCTDWRISYNINIVGG